MSNMDRGNEEEHVKRLEFIPDSISDSTEGNVGDEEKQIWNLQERNIINQSTGSEMAVPLANPNVIHFNSCFPKSLDKLGCVITCSEEEKKVGYSAPTDMEISMMNLYSYCDSQNVSRGFMDGFLELLNKEVLVRNFDITQHPKRETFVQSIMKKYGNNLNMPERVTTTLENVFDQDRIQDPDEFLRKPHDLAETIRFNFVAQLKDLLEDYDTWSRLENLE